jgi:hypothetical protein
LLGIFIIPVNFYVVERMAHRKGKREPEANPKAQSKP